jgi:Gram-negative bacterial TonB protein C-terminal
MKYMQAFGKASFAIGILVMISANISQAQTPVDAQPAARPTADAATKNSCTKQSSPPKLSYPKRARAMGITGTVVVEMRIDADGVPQSAKVVERRLNKTSVASADGGAENVTNIFDTEAINFAQGLSCSKRAGQRSQRGAVIQVPLKFDLAN